MLLSAGMEIVSTLRKTALICVVLLVFGAYPGLGSNIESVPVGADSALVSQSGPSPIRLDQTADLNNVVYLMAVGSAHSPDLVGEIMVALDTEGIDFMLYYHRGHEGDPWFDVSVFPLVEFTQRGTGDRSGLFNGWGIHEEGQSIMTKVTPADAAKWRAAAAACNVPISFTLMMWEDGAVSQDSLELFQA